MSATVGLTGTVYPSRSPSRGGGLRRLPSPVALVIAVAAGLLVAPVAGAGQTDPVMAMVQGIASASSPVQLRSSRVRCGHRAHRRGAVGHVRVRGRAHRQAHLGRTRRAGGIDLRGLRLTAAELGSGRVQQIDASDESAGAGETPRIERKAMFIRRR